jgi:hypothetical protein
MSQDPRNDCGCCEGVAVETPVPLDNRPGLSAIVYRVGTYATFRRSLEARLSDSRWPVLRRLRTRDDDDFTIALLDAWAVTGDILTFYQERIANEAYLRTATERLSILEQSRLLGYQLGPGLAAATHLAFTMEETPGAPEQSAKPMTLAIGTKVQSVPGPDEQPQTFETIEAIEARPGWNAILAQLTETQTLAWNMTELWLNGTALTLVVGDAVLIVADNAGAFQGSLRRITRLEPDPTLGSTKVSLAAISDGAASIDATEPGVFVMRTIASPFGHNAPKEAIYNEWGRFVEFSEWELDTERGDQLTLSSREHKILMDSWTVVEREDESASGKRIWTFTKVIAVTHQSVTKYGMAGSVTKLTFDKPVWISKGRLQALRQITVSSQSEELPLARLPLAYPVYGKELSLDSLVDGLVPGRPIAVSGKRQVVRIKQTNPVPTLHLDPEGSVSLALGDRLRMMGIPMKRSEAGFEELTSPEFGDILKQSSGKLRLQLMDRDGKTGMLEIEATGLELVPSSDKEETVREIAFLEDHPATAITPDRDRITLQLAKPLRHVYERTTVRSNANVATATHGETVGEPLGSGDATVPYQRFTLKQPPLTYVGADGPSGSASTLKVYVNELLWEEVPFFYGHGPTERIYITRRDDDGRTTISFGGGITGARLPTGQNNVRAEYRKGTGLGGLVEAGQLSLLMSRPLGLKGVFNPEAAQGAKNPEVRDDARENAPLTVLTLERAVSLQDYEDFAGTFAGITKAQAVWVWDGRKRSVFLTVAVSKGKEPDVGGLVMNKLKEALRTYGDPYVPFTVETYRQAWFEVAGTVTVHPNHVMETVMAAVRRDLEQRYSFETRSFGQPVALSDVIAAIQAVSGVVAVDVDRFSRQDRPLPPGQPRLIADRPAMGADGLVAAAELLLLDPLSLIQLKGLR